MMTVELFMADGVLLNEKPLAGKGEIVPGHVRVRCVCGHVLSWPGARVGGKFLPEEKRPGNAGLPEEIRLGIRAWNAGVATVGEEDVSPLEFEAPCPALDLPMPIRFPPIRRTYIQLVERTEKCVLSSKLAKS
jgi:hypothetical protein